MEKEDLARNKTWHMIISHHWRNKIGLSVVVDRYRGGSNARLGGGGGWEAKIESMLPYYVAIPVIE